MRQRAHPNAADLEGGEPLYERTSLVQSAVLIKKVSMSSPPARPALTGCLAPKTLLLNFCWRQRHILRRPCISLTSNLSSPIRPSGGRPFHCRGHPCFSYCALCQPLTECTVPRDLRGKSCGSLDHHLPMCFTEAAHLSFCGWCTVMARHGVGMIARAAQQLDGAQRALANAQFALKVCLGGVAWCLVDI